MSETREALFEVASIASFGRPSLAAISSSSSRFISSETGAYGPTSGVLSCRLRFPECRRLKALRSPAWFRPLAPHLRYQGAHPARLARVQRQARLASIAERPLP